MNSTYKIDFINNTLTMSKAFEAAASNPNSKEYKLLQQLRADFPGLTVARKTRRASKKAQPTKNLTYANIISRIFFKLINIVKAIDCDNVLSGKVQFAVIYITTRHCKGGGRIVIYDEPSTFRAKATTLLQNEVNTRPKPLL